MKTKIVGLALLAVLATMAFGVVNAMGAEWFINGSKLSGSEKVGAAKHVRSALEEEKLGGVTPLELSAPALGFKLTATGVSCVECTIDNNTAGVAHSAGKLKFAGVSVDEPKGCVVASELTTNALTDEVIMGVTAGHTEEVYDKFFTDKNAGGELEPFITIKITECAAAGSYKVAGSVTGLASKFNSGTGTIETDKTGNETTPQKLTFDSNAQTNGGGALTMGGKTAQLMGEVDNTLTGTNTGKAFGAK